MQRLNMVSVFALALMGGGSALAQHRASPRDLYERLILIVPMTGTGTYADPRRPQFAPLPAAMARPGTLAGIVSFSYQVSDDGQFAVVELVARDRAVFTAILRTPGVVAFERGKVRAEDIELEIRKHIRNFDVSRFGARAQ
ncbi:MAG: hypothetical protein HY235_26290 [Acidobacteria bacterium]|nr:hypothetical protein [Acidobacteriota bacterium]